jgi:hypothetical protein
MAASVGAELVGGGGLELLPPHEERKISKEQAANNLSILISMFISFWSNVVYFGLFIVYKELSLNQEKNCILTQKMTLKKY